MHYTYMAFLRSAEIVGVSKCKSGRKAEGTTKKKKEKTIIKAPDRIPHYPHFHQHPETASENKGRLQVVQSP